MENFNTNSRQIIGKFWLLLIFILISPVHATEKQQQWTFDGQIHNNSLAISPDEKTAVVSISSHPEVFVYQLDTGKVRARLNQFITPRNILFHPNGRYFYVSDSSLGTITKISTKSLKTQSHLIIGAGAFGTAMSNDGSTLYVNNEAANTVTIFDLINERPLMVITGFSQPRQGVRLAPDGKTLFVTNFLGNKVSVVDTATHHIIDEIVGFNKIRAIAITHDGKTLFAANSGSNTIAVVDIAARKIINEIPVGREPFGAALSPDESHLYSGNREDNSLSVIDLPAMKVTATITGLDEPRQAIIFTRDGKNAWVLNKDFSLSRVDIALNKVIARISG